MKNRNEIEKELSLAIASALEAKVRECGEASLLVSGGSTPINMFQLLSEYKINWEKISISLVDERLVTKDHKDLNERLVRDYLLKNAAKDAQFIPLMIDESDEELNLKAARRLAEQIKKPFTAVVLGMGTDGHTASLFPESPQLHKGMALDGKEELIVTEPITAPYKRISYTRRALLNTDHLFLHCYGIEKKEILKKVHDKKGEEYPISGFINQNKVSLAIYWAN